MTKYNLQEFKQWLEANPAKKGNLPHWNSFFALPRNFSRENVEQSVKITGHWLNQYYQITLEWMEEVEHQERERERAEVSTSMKCIKCQKDVAAWPREPGNICHDCLPHWQPQPAEEALSSVDSEVADSPAEETNMLNAQDWLNQQFPTPESRAKIKRLDITAQPSPGTNPTINETQHIIYGVSLAGILDLKEFVNLTYLMVNCPQITAIKGLENCQQLTYLSLKNYAGETFTFLEAWKQEIEQLKGQLAEYEGPETSSDANEPLNTKIQRKKQELQQAITGGRKSTAHLRKEIELLEKIQTLEGQISQLQAKEANYQAQIQQKDQQIAAKQNQLNQIQSQLNAKTTAEQQARTKIAQLEGQIQNLNAEKQAIQEKMLAERQTALNQWNQEKATLQAQIAQLKEQKDTFQKSANYLRETLKGTEKALEDTQSKLTNTENQAQEEAVNHQATLTQKEQELTKKQENYKLIQERNTELQAKLTAAQEEIGKLTEWISKLEAASVEGDAFQTLQKELAHSQQQILALQEQLDAKSPRKNYLWLYALLALVALYFLMN